MRILKVRGEGSVSEFPNLVIINFVVTSLNYNYDQAIQELNNLTNILRQDIKQELKTINFYVTPKYQRQNNDNIFLGYEAVHELELQLPYDKEMLNNLIQTISESKAKASFRINFSIENIEVLRQKAISEAVKDAQNNANVIASSANVKIGKILNIDYTTQHMPFRSMQMANIEPKPIMFQEQVTVEWEILDY